ncbi:MAG: hypothetical protein MUC36_05605 [Planctomycetes bacterium]|nr:hypothetical protein [Planctomycetota bacterium]
MSSLRRLCAVLVSVLAVATAQQSPPPGLDFARAHGAMLDESGTPWLLGPDYKAACRDGGLDFMPALGPRAATTATLSFRLQSIGRAESAPVAVAAVPPRLAGNRVQFVHEVGESKAILENYDATAAGVEQSFVFAVRPDGAGDLCVRGAVQTGLRPLPPRDGAIGFTDGRVGGVRIGGVTGIDANGRRCAGSSSYTDGVLELRLPAAFVDTAVYPLTLDPLFGTTLTVGGTAFDDDRPVAAYDASNGLYVVVWTRTFSSGDRDVRAQRVDASGALVGGLVAITSGSTDDGNPAVASVASRDRFVVCWQTGSGPFGPYDIECRSIDAATGSLGTTLSVGVGATNDILPAISGDRSAFGSQALIVWVSIGTGLLARPVVVSPVNTLSLGATQVVDPTFGNGVIEPPRLLQSTQPGAIGIVVWSELGLNFTGSARAIDYSGAPLGTRRSLFSFASDGDVAVDGNGNQFLIVQDGPGASPTSVALVPAQWNGTDLVLGTASTLPNTGNARDYAVGFLGDRYLVAFCGPTANPFDSEVRAVAVKPDCTVCSQIVTVPTVVRANQQTPAIATHFAASTSGPSGEALLLWNETEALPPFAGSVVGQRFTAMQGAPPVVLSPSCPGGGTAGTNGPFALGNAGFRFTLSGGDPSAPLALLGLSAGGLAPIPCGCTFVQSLQTIVATAVAGTAESAFAVPCDPLLLGFVLEYQWLLFGTAASPCPLLANVSGSDRRQLVLSQ